MQVKVHFCTFVGQIEYLQMDTKFRCDCPVTSALDILGDKWMLVIIKQMLIEGKETFKDFTESDEAVASNILSSKLKSLEQYGLIERVNHKTNRKTKLYHLTARGLSLSSIIVELAIWSDQNLRKLNPIIRKTDELESMKRDKKGFIKKLEENYKEKFIKARNTL